MIAILTEEALVAERERKNGECAVCMEDELVQNVLVDDFEMIQKYALFRDF